jgi:hypothetical protein
MDLLLRSNSCTTTLWIHNRREASDTGEVNAMKTAARAVTLGMTALVGAGVLGGCVYRTRETVPAASPPSTVVVTPSTSNDRVVSYPEGRWELRGDGSSTVPYYWVWIPAGSSPPNPPAPPRTPR